MKNKVLLVLGTLIIVGSFVGAMQVASKNQQAGVLKSTAADKAIKDATVNKVIGGTAVQEKVFVIGGGQNSVYQTINALLWSVLTPTAQFPNRVSAGSLYFNNKLYLLGGSNAIGTTVDDAWSSVDGNNWIQISTAAVGYQFGSLVFQGKMWVIGGCTKAIPAVYNSTDGISWTNMPANTPLGPRGCISNAVVYNNQIWVMGDPYSPFLPGPNLWSSADGTNWNLLGSNLPSLQIGQYGATPKLLVHDGKLWLIGGNAFYTTDGITWTQTYSGGQLPIAQHIVYTMNNVMYTTGGFFAMAGSPPNTIFSSSDGITWTQTPMNFSWHPTYTDAVVTPISFGTCQSLGLDATSSSPGPNLVNGAQQIISRVYANGCAQDTKITKLSYQIAKNGNYKLGNYKLYVDGVFVANPAPSTTGTAFAPEFNVNILVPAGGIKTMEIRADVSAATSGNTVSTVLKNVQATIVSSNQPATFSPNPPLSVQTLIKP